MCIGINVCKRSDGTSLQRTGCCQLPWIHIPALQYFIWVPWMKLLNLHEDNSSYFIKLLNELN